MTSLNNSNKDSSNFWVNKNEAFSRGIAIIVVFIKLRLKADCKYTSNVIKNRIICPLSKWIITLKQKKIVLSLFTFSNRLEIRSIWIRARSTDWISKNDYVLHNEEKKSKFSMWQRVLARFKWAVIIRQNIGCLLKRVIIKFWTSFSLICGDKIWNSLPFQRDCDCINHFWYSIREYGMRR